MIDHCRQCVCRTLLASASVALSTVAFVAVAADSPNAWLDRMANAGHTGRFPSPVGQVVTRQGGHRTPGPEGAERQRPGRRVRRPRAVVEVADQLADIGRVSADVDDRQKRLFPRGGVGGW